MCRRPPSGQVETTKEVAPLKLCSASASRSGSLYEEMMKRQQLLRNFETYVHEKDAADSAEKTREALLHVTGKSESCTPLITGGLCMGITPPMTQIRCLTTYK